MLYATGLLDNLFSLAILGASDLYLYVLLVFTLFALRLIEFGNGKCTLGSNYSKDVTGPGRGREAKTEFEDAVATILTAYESVNSVMRG